MVSWATPDAQGYEVIDYGDEPYSKAIERIQRLVDDADLLVGFNFKFDLHWLRRYNINFASKRIWCCQLVEFYLDCQRTSYPSLDGCLAKYHLGSKSDIVARDYWDKGIDTPDIPINILSEYAVKDAILTRALYLHQTSIVQCTSPQFRSLLSLHMSDLLVLEEMEWNGLLLDIEGCSTAADEVTEQVKEIDKQLHEFFKVDWVNFESPQQLSALLFGGSITKTWREQVGVYKSGQKIGQPRFSVKRETHEFQRLVEPSKGTGLANGGWSTSEDSLRSIKSKGKSVKAVFDLLSRRSKLEKLRGTYYSGLPTLLSTMGWQGSLLHGTINQCVARTGRTSSSKPNLQNMPPEIDRLFRSRFGSGGTLVQADAKGLEWVGIVYLSQDAVGIVEITQGEDQHLKNQERFGLPTKKVAKFFVFRLIYGGTPYTFTKDPDFTFVSTSEDFWQDVMDQFYDKYRGIKKIHVEWVKLVSEGGMLVTPTGRMFKFDLNALGEWPRTQILNYPVQSLGADLMAIARVSLARRMKKLKLKSVLINTIHDSIVLDIFNEEWYTISTLLNEVFADIPKNFEKLFGKVFNLPMKCEVKRLDGEEITQ
jgi:DNA polymerase I-like protein with 3'-5' exonuclease and polymerase domains